MYVFDMVVYVGMCRDSCIMNDVLSIVTCVGCVLVEYCYMLLSLQDV